MRSVRRIITGAIGSTITLVSFVGSATAQSQQVTPLSGFLDVNTDDSWKSHGPLPLSEPSSVTRSCGTDRVAQVTEAKLRFYGERDKGGGLKVVYDWKVTVSGNNNRLKGNLVLVRSTCKGKKCKFEDTYTIPTRASADGQSFVGMTEWINTQNVGVHKNLKHIWKVSIPPCPPPDRPEIPEIPPPPETPPPVVEEIIVR